MADIATKGNLRGLGYRCMRHNCRPGRENYSTIKPVRTWKMLRICHQRFCSSCLRFEAICPEIYELDVSKVVVYHLKAWSWKASIVVGCLKSTHAIQITALTDVYMCYSTTCVYAIHTSNDMGAHMEIFTHVTAWYFALSMQVFKGFLYE